MALWFANRESMKAVREKINIGLDNLSQVTDRVTILETVRVVNLAVDTPVAEYGQDFTPALTWVLDGAAPVVRQTVNGSPIAPNTETWTAPVTITDDATYTVTVTDHRGRKDSASVSVDFKYRVFWGVSPSETLDAAGVLNLAESSLAGSLHRAMTVDATGGQYLFYAYPVVFGDVGWVTAFGDPIAPVVETVTLTTPAGYTGSYYVVRLPNTIDHAEAIWSVGTDGDADPFGVTVALDLSLEELTVG
ncbi:hypothetical protein DLJ53_18050 [Acuticoccus sediminis]|uniref:Uncharacterized protein n=1 Tax=Acuticoccus sediminis TaxID=2184697 RepID=A0A8B2NSU3_9HYPH|nr:hypothetical protein [Acuticoccus sediminis]RAI01119.1 hypothetical protein DLJ53_18050 [Acuticoccus sediminis]